MHPFRQAEPVGQIRPRNRRRHPPPCKNNLCRKHSCRHRNRVNPVSKASRLPRVHKPLPDQLQEARFRAVRFRPASRPRAPRLPMFPPKAPNNNTGAAEPDHRGNHRPANRAGSLRRPDSLRLVSLAMSASPASRRKPHPHGQGLRARPVPACRKHNYRPVSRGGDLRSPHRRSQAKTDYRWGRRRPSGNRKGESQGLSFRAPSHS